MSLAIVFAFNTAFNFAVALLVAKFLGPAEYGRFALASAVAVFLNTALFDWIRLSATRFYSDKTRETDPGVRATLDAVFGGGAALLTACVLAIILSGVDLPLTHGLLALAAATGVANALFDYSTALIRSRFLDRAYRRAVLTKHVAAMAFTVGGAWWLQSAHAALIGVCLSAAFSLMSVRRDLADPGGGTSQARRRLAATYMGYGMPIVLASVVYQSVPLLNRAEVAAQHGFAETGQYALAYDMGIRVIAAIGSTLDVLLFQLAVRVEEQEGARRAMERIGQNMGVVFAVVAPTCLGFWLTLPSFEAVFAPAAYRGPFAHYLSLFLPGIFAFALLQYGVAPAFQIEKKTLPLVIAALLAALANLATLALAPASQGAAIYAIGQSAALVTGFAALAGLALLQVPARPSLRDALSTLAACALMSALLMPLRDMTPGLASLALQAALGAAACAAVYLTFNTGDCRRLARLRLKPLLN